jgi:hypothetical protein
MHCLEGLGGEGELIETAYVLTSRLPVGMSGVCGIWYRIWYHYYRYDPPPASPLLTAF